MFGLTKRKLEKRDNIKFKQIFLRSPILRCFANLRAKTIVYFYIGCSMIIIMACLITLINLIIQYVSQTFEKSSEIIFDIDSKRLQSINKQNIEIFWVTFIHSLSQPLISLHRLYNFYQMQHNLQANFYNSELNCFNKELLNIKNDCFCDLDNTIVHTNHHDLLINLNSMLQFDTFLPTQIFGVQQYMGFFDNISKHLFNYPCLFFGNNKSYDPKTRPWYIEAEKAYQKSNFDQYSVRLTEHYLTIPFNDIRFSMALPVINFDKSMIGALRVHIKSTILQDLIYNKQNEINLILTTNEGMLLVSNLFNNTGFELGKDYFQNQTKTGFNLEDWEALTYTNQSNCNHLNIGFICRKNKIDNQEYYLMYTSLEQYNLQIILYQTKYQYYEYIQNQQTEMKDQINNELIKGITILIGIAILVSLISTLLLGLMIKPLQQIATIFQITRDSSSQSITQRFQKIKISNNYAGIFRKPGCFISKEIFLLCQCIQQFITNFSSVNKKSNIIYEQIDQLKYPKKEELQNKLLDYFQKKTQNKIVRKQQFNQWQLIYFVKQCLVESTKKEY